MIPLQATVNNQDNPVLQQVLLLLAIATIAYFTYKTVKRLINKFNNR